MTKTRLPAAALFASALWAGQPAMGQDPVDGVCDESVRNGCAAGRLNALSSPAHPPPLFTAASDAAQVALEPSTAPAIPRPSQSVQIGFERLSQARAGLAEGRGVELTVNLPGLPLPVVLTGASDTARGYGLTGRVANDPLSSVNIVVNGRSVAGNIRRAGELHTIRTAGAGHYVQTLDGLTLPRCEVGRLGDVASGAPAPPRQSLAVANVAPENAAEDDGSEIDVLVVYTPSGRRSAGGHRGIRTLIELVVQETNKAYGDSGVRQRIRLVAAAEVDYESQDFSIHDALTHLTEKADGHMDEVHEIRDLYAADLVLLFRPSGGGTAWLAADPSAETAESFGFSVSNWHVFAHELGHNMGLMHHRDDDAGNLPYPYSHGYRFRHGGVHYGTIMSTAYGLLRFSNPRHLFPNDLGVPLGIPGDTPTSSPDGPADAARSLNETAKAIANFRPSAARCHYNLPSPKDIPAQGGSFTVSVATSANCPWDARSLDPRLSITEGLSGTGDGRIAFVVEENRGWPREVALRIAGEVYSFGQEGGRQAVSVCDRSIHVREAISAALDGQPCADIVTKDLGRIGSLRVQVGFQGTVSPGDFDGLTGLGHLTLRYHDVPHLDQGAFAGAGLESLRRLWVIASPTRTLHLRSGVFEGLDALEELDLFGVTWERGLFEDTPSLVSLVLLDYPRNTLPNGAFSGLNRLANLSAHRGLFETVGARAFQGLSGLRLIALKDGRLAHLPPSSFADVPELTTLVLEGNRLTALRRGQFQGASKLDWIDLRDNPMRIVDSGAFSGLPLRYLNLSNGDLTSLDLDVFSGLLNCELDLSGNQLTTVDPRVLAGARLVLLDLSDNYISNIGFLAALSSAREIDLSGNRIEDLSPLTSVDKLLILNLSGNRIVDVSPLAELSGQLTYLDLSHNEIADVSPLLAQGSSIGEDSSLFLHGNRLQGTALDDQVSKLRSRGIRAFHVGVLPMDSSAFEGDEFEFAVRLSSGVSYPISVDWQLVFAYRPDRRTVLSDVLLTATMHDFDFGLVNCAYGACYNADGLTGGELAIGAGDRMGYATVSGVENQAVEEEGHETFAFVLLPGASGLPVGVTLDSSLVELRDLFGATRQSIAVGLIVDRAGPSHDIPFFLARGSAQGRQSVLRLVHPMDGSPVHVEVFDGLGGKHGSTTLSTRHARSVRKFDPSRSAVAQLNSEDLEDGNHGTGLSKGVGQGSGDWHLKVWANDAQALTYVRHADGFLTSMHDVAPQGADGTYEVPTFNPAGNTLQRSILRLVNPGTEASGVRIVGTDDAGALPGDAVSLSIEPGGARELSAADLEAGAGDLGGALGDGQGKWRLSVASDQPLLVASLVESPTGHLTNLSTVPDNKEQGAATTHHVPLFLSAADEMGRRSFVRIINRDEAAATVRIRPFDDTVRDYGAVTLTVAAGEAAHFNSHHLEVGGAGLSGGVGAGEGDWRLELEAMEDIDVLSYVRHADGFLTAMHDVVRASPEGHVVPIFNPADDGQRSLLRLVNPRGEDAEVTIRGIDDRGVTRGSMSLVVPAGRSRTISAQEMEAGHDTLAGALGDGQGKWRLVVRSEVEVHVMSLLESPAGHLTNLSTTPLELER